VATVDQAARAGIDEFVTARKIVSRESNGRFEAICGYKWNSGHLTNSRLPLVKIDRRVLSNAGSVWVAAAGVQDHVTERCQIGRARHKFIADNESRSTS
jgi:hypothetical protein